MKFVVEYKHFGKGEWEVDEEFDTAQKALEYASLQAMGYAATDHRVVVHNVPRVIATFEPMEDYR